MQNMQIPVPEFVRVRLENEARRVGFPPDHLASLLIQDGLIRRSDARRDTLDSAYRQGSQGRAYHCLSCGCTLQEAEIDVCDRCSSGLTEDTERMIEEGRA